MRDWEGYSLDEVLSEVGERVKPHFGKGHLPDYIPELSAVPERAFGMAIRTVDGRECVTGDADTPFSTQSISKVFALALALNRVGDEVWTRVGKEPSGTPFNHLAQLEAEQGIPRNPFVNAGALVVTDILLGSISDPAELLRRFVGCLAAADLVIDEQVARSEWRHAHRNRALANLLKAYGTITHDADAVLFAYCRQCALSMTCRQLARAAQPLASAGYSSIAGETVFTERLARRLNALLLTCGIYDSVGSFAYRVGLPAKSGVGGGIVAVVPSRATLAVWAPELDRFGTSVVGTAALEAFVQLTHCSVF